MSTVRVYVSPTACAAAGELRTRAKGRRRPDGQLRGRRASEDAARARLLGLVEGSLYVEVRAAAPAREAERKLGASGLEQVLLFLSDRVAPVCEVHQDHHVGEQPLGGSLERQPARRLGDPAGVLVHEPNGAGTGSEPGDGGALVGPDVVGRQFRARRLYASSAASWTNGCGSCAAQSRIRASASRLCLRSLAPSSSSVASSHSDSAWIKATRAYQKGPRREWTFRRRGCRRCSTTMRRPGRARSSATTRISRWR